MGLFDFTDYVWFLNENFVWELHIWIQWNSAVMLSVGSRVFLLHRIQGCGYSRLAEGRQASWGPRNQSGHLKSHHHRYLFCHLLRFLGKLWLKHVHFNTGLLVIKHRVIDYTYYYRGYTYSYLYKPVFCSLFFPWITYTGSWLMLYLLGICIIFFVVLWYSLRLVSYYVF